MNLNDQPTVEQLAQLIAQQRDSVDSHILWVCAAGEVHIDRLAAHGGELAFEERTPNMRARLKLYRRGQGYMGRKAAADTEYVGRVLQTLEGVWGQIKQVKVVDRHC
jgi:hypothetical protein